MKNRMSAFPVRDVYKRQGLPLLRAKLCIQDQLLQGKAKISYFSQIDGPLRGKSSKQCLRIGFPASNFNESAPRPIGIRVDLRGYGSLPDAMLANDQHRAVALGNPGNRTLNTPLNRIGRLGMPFHTMYRCFACHMKTRVHPCPATVSYTHLALAWATTAVIVVLNAWLLIETAMGR